MVGNEVTEADHMSNPDVHKPVMEATYRALCAHGAADLTVQAIADEFEKSKSLLFYHYNSKEDLLSSFLAYLIDTFEERMPTSTDDRPAERLEGLLEALLFGPEDSESFQTAMLELRSQAPYKEAYREQFRTNDEFLRGIFSDVIEQGIEEGVFHPVDSDRTAALFLSIIEGARMRRIVLDNRAVLETAAAGLRRRIEDDLLIDSPAKSDSN